MGDVHLDVLLDYLVIRALRHPVDGGKSGVEVHERSESEVALGDVDLTHLACEIVDVLKEIAMNLGKANERAHLKGIEQPALEQLKGALLGKQFLFAGKFHLVCNSQFIFKHRRSSYKCQTLSP